VCTDRCVLGVGIHQTGSSTPVERAGTRAERAMDPAKEEQWKD
jgi:hypothetical protein